MGRKLGNNKFVEMLTEVEQKYVDKYKFSVADLHLRGFSQRKIMETLRENTGKGPGWKTLKRCLEDKEVIEYITKARLEQQDFKEEARKALVDTVDYSESANRIAIYNETIHSIRILIAERKLNPPPYSGGMTGLVDENGNVDIKLLELMNKYLELLAKETLQYKKTPEKPVRQSDLKIINIDESKL